MRLRPAVQRSIAAALAAVAVPAACSHPHPAGPVAAPASAGSRTPVFSPSPPPISAAPRPPAPGTITLGHSALGRPITATETGDAGAGRRLVVVGCIHGNEPAGIAIARRIESLPPPSGTGVWVIEDLNPDGVASGTRQNGRGVDLNRRSVRRDRSSTPGRRRSRSRSPGSPTTSCSGSGPPSRSGTTSRSASWTSPAATPPSSNVTPPWWGFRPASSPAIPEAHRPGRTTSCPGARPSWSSSLPAR